jgi:hypothetical protein
MAGRLLLLAAMVGSSLAGFDSQTCADDSMVTIQGGAEAMIGGIISMRSSGTGFGCGLPSSDSEFSFIIAHYLCFLCYVIFQALIVSGHLLPMIINKPIYFLFLSLCDLPIIKCGIGLKT